MIEASDMVKERTARQLGVTIACLPGVQTGTMTAGQLVAMVGIVNMSLWLLMHGTAPDHSTPHVAPICILHHGCAPMVRCIVTCLQSLCMTKPDGAEARVVRQAEI